MPAPIANINIFTWNFYFILILILKYPVHIYFVNPANKCIKILKLKHKSILHENVPVYRLETEDLNENKILLKKIDIANVWDKSFLTKKVIQGVILYMTFSFYTFSSVIV